MEIIALNEVIKKRWVAALRSGEYEQGFDELQPDPGKYCCLGVLCCLHAEETDSEWESPDGTSDSCLGDSYYYSRMTLPDIVVKWAELPNENPEVTLAYDHRPGEDERPVIRALSSLNDSAKLNFSELADIIDHSL